MSKYFTSKELKSQGFSSWKLHITRHNEGEQIVVNGLPVGTPIEKTSYSVREVYYSADNKPVAVTGDPIFYAFFDSEEELKENLQNVLNEISKNETIDFKKIGRQSHESKQK